MFSLVQRKFWVLSKSDFWGGFGVERQIFGSSFDLFVSGLVTADVFSTFEMDAVDLWIFKQIFEWWTLWIRTIFLSLINFLVGVYNVQVLVSILNFETCCSNSADLLVQWYVHAALLQWFLLRIRFVRSPDTIVFLGTLLWLFSPAWNAIKPTLNVDLICPFVVIDPSDLGATMETIEFFSSLFCYFSKPRVEVAFCWIIFFNHRTALLFQALCLSNLNLSPTHNTCIFTNGNKANLSGIYQTC